MWYMVSINADTTYKIKQITLVNYEESRTLTANSEEIKRIIQEGLEVYNLDCIEGRLICTAGKYNDYIGKVITILKAIYKNRKLVGYAVSDWTGKIANLPINKARVIAKKLHITNGVSVETNKGFYIRGKGKSFEKIDIKQVVMTPDEIEEAKNSTYTNLLM